MLLLPTGCTASEIFFVCGYIWCFCCCCCWIPNVSTFARCSVYMILQKKMKWWKGAPEKHYQKVGTQNAKHIRAAMIIYDINFFEIIYMLCHHRCCSSIQSNKRLLGGATSQSCSQSANQPVSHSSIQTSRFISYSFIISYIVTFVDENG